MLKKRRRGSPITMINCFHDFFIDQTDLKHFFGFENPGGVTESLCEAGKERARNLYQVGVFTG
jgi:hypothetical protein